MDLFEIVIVLAVALIVLGPERLPEVLRTVGKVLRELRAASNTVMRELTDVLEDDPARADAETPPLEDPARATRPAAAQPVGPAPSAAAAPAVEAAAGKTEPPEHQPS
ncbi:MAG TPA: twin-arginine translocase TatA/TatE family subunit [Candidatus Binataceae bacterium]|nr:twin-arginine translocase TatA/TatE family subunit [Candidatus Binataceae bacterium]